MSSPAAPPAIEPGDSESRVSPADSKSYWPLLISLAVVAGLAELAYAIINISTLPVYLKFSLGLPEMVGVAGAAFLGTEALLNGPMGILADQIGRRRLMILGPMLSVFTCIATSLLHHLAHPHGSHADHAPLIAALLVLRVLDGVGAAALWPAIFASIGDRVPKEHEATAMSVLNVSYMLGVAFGPLVGGTLNDIFAGKHGLSVHDPLRYAPSFVSAAGAFLACSVIAIIVAPNRISNAKSAVKSDGTGAASEHGSTSVGHLMAALKRCPMLLVLVFVVFAGIGLISLNVKLFTMETFKISESLFGRILLIPAIVVASLSVPLGRLGDVWGKPRAIHVGLAICALSLWTIIIWQHLYVMILLGSILGVGFVLSFPAYMALISDIGGDNARGSLIGAVRTAQGLGMLMGVAFASPLYEHSHQLPFFLAGILVTCGFVVSVICIRAPKPA